MAVERKVKTVATVEVEPSVYTAEDYHSVVVKRMEKVGLYNVEDSEDYRSQRNEMIVTLPY